MVRDNQLELETQQHYEQVQRPERASGTRARTNNSIGGSRDITEFRSTQPTPGPSMNSRRGELAQPTSSASGPINAPS